MNSIGFVGNQTGKRCNSIQKLQTACHRHTKWKRGIKKNEVKTMRPRREPNGGKQREKWSSQQWRESPSQRLQWLWKSRIGFWCNLQWENKWSNLGMSPESDFQFWCSRKNPLEIAPFLDEFSNSLQFQNWVSLDFPNRIRPLKFNTPIKTSNLFAAR